ncbi:hypothetical protein F3Y22_tig00110890pilonHSYRG00819 [Hibiscus syriacus]|uniref:Uncharacterized protein n=1 Tax=Hibiscus syriacus TaxID=106335 RepID=A0A6A2ZHY5_HIBSY|nr:hypothetical protein F3Y22_tig00110890pilonHSYRG00819 [Hibiscus syriacus]
MAESFVRITGGSTESLGEEDDERSKKKLQLKPYCLELLELSQNPKKHASSIPALLHLLRSSPSNSLQLFLDYTLFPLLLMLDVAVDCRSLRSKSEFSNNKRVSDKVAERVVACLEVLLKKCHLGSVDQKSFVKELSSGSGLCF